MNPINIHEAKTHLSRLVERVEAGGAAGLKRIELGAALYDAIAPVEHGAGVLAHHLEVFQLVGGEVGGRRTHRGAGGGQLPDSHEHEKQEQRDDGRPRVEAGAGRGRPVALTPPQETSDDSSQQLRASCPACLCPRAGSSGRGSHCPQWHRPPPGAGWPGSWP